MSLRSSWLPIALIFFLASCATTPAADVAGSGGGLTQSPRTGHEIVLVDSDTIPILGSPTLGPVSAAVTIVAFSDLECPFCQRAAATLKELEKTYPEDVKLVFKHYPLPFHAQAGPGAQAAIAAGNQGKFWQMHDWLFANQRQMRQHSADFEDWTAEYAATLGLDVAQFRADYNAAQTAEIIKHDMALGAKLGVRGTPAFFINGVRVLGAQPFEVFAKTIGDQLEQAEALRASGQATDANLYAKLVAQNYAEERPEPRLPSLKDDPDNGANQPERRVDTSALTINPTQVKGPADARVTIFVFSDFQCPFCQRGDRNLTDALAQVDGSVRVVYKHLPLPFHQAAGPAALASMAAGAQGKFWQMHDLLFERQKELTSDDLTFYVQLADELGLDTEKFLKDMHRDDFAAEINQDIRQAEAVGARGTPSYLVNGTRVVGAQPTAVFVDAINEALAEKQ